jgi:hypothetical protein
LLSAAGYAAAAAVEALPSVDQLTSGWCSPYFVAVVPFHWVYVHDLKCVRTFPLVDVGEICPPVEDSGGFSGGCSVKASRKVHL